MNNDVDGGAGRCDVSVTGKHRIDAPYCKDCGQTFATTEGGERCAECSLCGHDGTVMKDGICLVQIPICSNEYHGNRRCGCKCVFPAPPEREQALQHARTLNQETETVFTDGQGTWYGSRLDNHPTTKSFEICSLCKQIDQHEDECPEGYHPLESYCPHGAVAYSNECLLCGPTASPDPATAAPACNHERELGKKVVGCFDCYPPTTTETAQPDPRVTLASETEDLVD